VSIAILSSDENRLAFGFVGVVADGRAGRGVWLSCEGNPFWLVGVEVPFRAGWSGDGGQDSEGSSASALGKGVTSGGSMGGCSGTVNHE